MSKAAEEYLISKGVVRDFKTLRLTSRMEDGILVKWMQEFADQHHQSEVNAISDERLDDLANNPFSNPDTQKERVCEIKLLKNKLLNKQ